MNDNFVPAPEFVEVEPISSSGVLASDENNKWEEKARIIQVRDSEWREYYEFKVGDIIFFRRHGFFELAEHDGKKHYVVRVSPEFILGIIKYEKLPD
jgi:co-chaperonin GroES (HSP10)